MIRSSPDPRIVWDSGSWQLQVVSIRLPDGSSGEKAIIDHPGSVVLVPVRDSESGIEVLMLRQYRLALGQAIMELPAGTREHGEAWLHCAQRELREETGYRAETFEPLGKVWPAPGLLNEQMAIYLASGLVHDPLPQDIDEDIEVQPMLLDNLLEMVQNYQIQDAKSCLGLMRAADFMKKT